MHSKNSSQHMRENPDFERLNAAVLCNAIYNKNPHSILQNCNYCSIDGFARSVPQEDSLCFGIANDKKRGTLYLVVRGFVDIEKWNCDLAIPQVYKSFIGNGAKSSISDQGAVHAGFLSCAERLPLEELLMEHDKLGKRIVLCGHSIGGAVAAIATTIILKRITHRRNDVTCYTFGSPLFCGTEFAQYLNETGDCAALEHWVHPEDPVPKLLLSHNGTELTNYMKNVGLLGIRTLFTAGGWFGVKVSKRLTKSALDNLVSSITTTSSSYAVVGRVCDIVKSERGSKPCPLPLESLDSLDPIDFSKAQSFMVASNHEMDNYLDLLVQNCVHAVDQREVDPLSENVGERLDRSVVDTLQEWKPSFSDIFRAGFEDEDIRFELVGYRFGSLLPLTSLDVLVDGKALESEPCLIANYCLGVAYSIPLPKALLGKEQVNLEVRFHSTMANEPEEKRQYVDTTWYEDRETKVKTGSIVDLLAHLRASVLVKHPRNNRGYSTEVVPVTPQQQSTESDTGNGTSIGDLDRFLAKYLRDEDKSDLTKVFNLLDDCPPSWSKEAILCELVISLVGQIGGDKREISLSSYFNQFKDSDNRFHRLARNILKASKQRNMTTEDFHMPLTTNVLSPDVSASSATAEIFRFEGATNYVLLKRWNEMVWRAIDAKMSRIRRGKQKRGKNFLLAGAATFALTAGLVLVLGPGAAAGGAAINAFVYETLTGLSLASVGVLSCGLATYGTANILLSFLSGPGKKFTHASSAVAEVAVLSMMDKRNAKTLKEHEDRFLSWVGTKMPWDEFVLVDDLKDMLEEERREMAEFAQGFVRPVASLREKLLQERTFTIAIVGEPGSGKTNFISNAYQTVYKERTSEQQSHVIEVQSRAGDTRTVHILDFPGMNGNDEFAGANIENLTAILPAVDCILFFSKLNTRCFLADKLMEEVQGCCKIRMVLTHGDTVLMNKYGAMIEEEVEDLGILDEDDIDEERILDKAVESMVQDKEKLRSQLALREKDVVFWVPKRMLGKRFLSPFFGDALKPHLASTENLKDWIGSLVY